MPNESSRHPRSAFRSVNLLASKFPRQKAKALHSRRWLLYAGAFVVVIAVVAALTIWLTNRDSEQPSSQGPDQTASSKAEGNFSVEDVAVPERKASGDSIDAVQRSPQSRNDVQMPDPKPANCASLPTDNRIGEDIGTNGHGTLTIENGTSEDAAAELSDVRTDGTVRYFFVQAHSSAEVAKIARRGIHTCLHDWSLRERGRSRIQLACIRQ